MSEGREAEVIGPAAWVSIACCTVGCLAFWSFGISETLRLLVGLDGTVWSKALAFTAFIVFGDLVGTRISDVPRHNLRQTLARSAAAAAVGLVLAMNARALILGVNLFVPQAGTWSIVNALRAGLMYVLGAVFVSFGYSLVVPGYFARKAARENQPPKAAELIAKYTLRRQIIKTWNGVKGRWWVVLANYWYMNLLPWGWLTADVGFGIVCCGVNIYVAFKSTAKGLDAPFGQRLWGRLPGGSGADRQTVEPGNS
jgi:hypothetical protein